jgi:hypothetical protein
MKKLMLLVVCLWIVCLANSVFADDTSQQSLTPGKQQVVRARIGIEIRTGGKSRLAKLYDQVMAGDTYCIYVVPEPDPGYVYVICADQKTADLLEEVVIPKDNVLFLPSRTELYQFTADDPDISIIIICSATQLPVIENLFKNQECPVATWKDLEPQLIKDSTIDDLSKLPDKSWTLAGVTRENVPKEIADVLETLKISSGQSLVIKRYEFQISPKK